MWTVSVLECAGYSVRPVEGKGLGLVARRDFSRGDLVLSETAAIKVKRGSPSSGWSIHQAVQIIRQFKRLSVEQREMVLDLECGHFSDRPQLIRVLNNNCIKIDHNNFGLFILISRMNHSCRPNCLDSEGEEKEVRAVRRIKTGEELCISYLSCGEGTSQNR